MLERGDLVRIISLNKEGYYFLSLDNNKAAVVVIDNLDTWWSKYLVVDSADIQHVKGDEDVK